MRRNAKQAERKKERPAQCEANGKKERPVKNDATLPGHGLETDRPARTFLAAHRGGHLRTAELLDILNTIVPCAPGEEATTPAIRFPVSRMGRLKKREEKSLAKPTMKRVMNWYHQHCQRAGVPHHEKVKPHSFRIAGATLLFSQ